MDRILNRMIITKVGYTSVPVALTDNEVMAIEAFIDWAGLEDEYQIETVDEYSYEEWGKGGKKIKFSN